MCSRTVARPAAFESTAFTPIQPALVRRSIATGVRGGAPVIVSGSDTPDARSRGADTRSRASAVDGMTNTTSTSSNLGNITRDDPVVLADLALPGEAVALEESDARVVQERA